VDTVLTRLQAGQKQLVSARGLVEHVGVLSLWRGSSAMIGAVPLQNALLMGGYGMGKRWSSGMENADTLSAIFVGGCVGGVLQSFLMSPVELIKVNQQVHTEQSALAAGKDVVRRTIVKQGAVWRGLTATLLRDGIPHGVWFLSYEVCKNNLEAATSIGNGKEDILKTPQGKNWGIPLVSGAVAATVAWVSQVIDAFNALVNSRCSKCCLRCTLCIDTYFNFILCTRASATHLTSLKQESKVSAGRIDGWPQQQR
jgi:solute carrier family 25 (mitochondrial carnitine/acylcarnitine transporter), member 20/29